MSLANDLLNSITVEEDDKTLVINHYTRSINIPKGITTLGVESDDDVLRLNFKMPRYLGTVDLYNFSIRVNYINAEGEDDVYKVTDKAVVGNNVTFSWLVGPTAVAYKGVTKFNVSLIITDSNSVIKQEYNTAIASLPVLEGMETSERVVSEYTDILEQWERRLFGISDTEEAKLLAFSEEQQTNIAEKGAEVLATIPEDYQTTAKLANEGARSKADAIICSAEGAAISVADSSDDYVRGLNLYGKTTQVKTTGKNLLDLTVANRDVSGATLKVNADKSITLNGTVNTNTSVIIGKFRHSGVFVISTGVSFNDLNTSYLYMTLSDGTNVGWYGKEVPFEHDGAERTLILVVIAGVYSNVTFYPMIRYSSINDASYEPYTGGKPAPNPEYPQELISIANPSVDVYGKNLWDHTNDQIDLLNAQGWGNPVWLNNTVVNTLRPNTTYTLSFNATCLEIPEYNSVFSGHCGFVLYSSKPNAIPTVMARYEGDMFVVGDKIFVSATFTTPSNVDDPEMNYEILRYTQRFLKEDGNAVHATVRFENVQLEIGSISTEFEECMKRTLPVSYTLPGIPVTSGGNYTDENGQQWICDEIDFERGMYVQRTGTRVLTGDTSEEWGLYNPAEEGKVFHCYLVMKNYARRWPTTFCDRFRNVSIVWERQEYGLFSDYNTSDLLYFSAPSVDVIDMSTWRAWLSNNPTTLVYLLATPIETPLTADELAAFQALKTNYPNTTVLNDSGVWMSLRYNADTKTWINNLIDEKITAAVAKLQ